MVGKGWEMQQKTIRTHGCKKMHAQSQDLQTTPSWQVANCKKFNVSSRNQSLQSWWHECVADAVLGPVWYPIENANPQAHSQWITVDSRWMIIRIIRPGLSPVSIANRRDALQLYGHDSEHGSPHHCSAFGRRNKHLAKSLS